VLEKDNEPNELHGNELVMLKARGDDVVEHLDLYDMYLALSSNQTLGGIVADSAKQNEPPSSIQQLKRARHGVKAFICCGSGLCCAANFMPCPGNH
jgi:hypothetical protein